MCYVVYIATDQTLELGSFKPNETTIYFSTAGRTDEAVQKLFSKANIYYVGSSTACSCGLDYYMPNYDNPLLEDQKRSPQAFIDFLRLATQTHEVEFYCFYFDHVELPIKHRRTIDIRTVSLRDNYFGLVENEFITFVKQSDQTPKTHDTQRSPRTSDTGW